MRTAALVLCLMLFTAAFTSAGAQWYDFEITARVVDSQGNPAEGEWIVYQPRDCNHLTPAPPAEFHITDANGMITVNEYGACGGLYSVRYASMTKSAWVDHDGTYSLGTFKVPKQRRDVQDITDPDPDPKAHGAPPQLGDLPLIGDDDMPNGSLLIGDDDIPSLIGDDDQPTLTVLGNPVRAITRIEFQARTPAFTTVTIHDVQGRSVAALFEGTAAGRRTVTWDGRDAAGRRLNAGIYFVRLQAGPDQATRKLTLIR